MQASIKRQCQVDFGRQAVYFGFSFLKEQPLISFSGTSGDGEFVTVDATKRAGYPFHRGASLQAPSGSPAIDSSFKSD
jgi:hypothetical protein